MIIIFVPNLLLHKIEYNDLIGIINKYPNFIFFLNFLFPVNPVNCYCVKNKDKLVKIIKKLLK